MTVMIPLSPANRQSLLVMLVGYLGVWLTLAQRLREWTRALAKSALSPRLAIPAITALDLVARAMRTCFETQLNSLLDLNARGLTSPPPEPLPLPSGGTPDDPALDPLALTWLIRAADDSRYFERAIKAADDALARRRSRPADAASSPPAPHPTNPTDPTDPSDLSAVASAKVEASAKADPSDASQQITDNCKLITVSPPALDPLRQRAQSLARSLSARIAAARRRIQRLARKHALSFEPLEPPLTQLASTLSEAASDLESAPPIEDKNPPSVSALQVPPPQPRQQSSSISSYKSHKSYKPYSSPSPQPQTETPKPETSFSSPQLKAASSEPQTRVSYSYLRSLLNSDDSGPAPSLIDQLLARAAARAPS